MGVKRIKPQRAVQGAGRDGGDERGEDAGRVRGTPDDDQQLEAEAGANRGQIFHHHMILKDLIPICLHERLAETLKSSLTAEMEPA
ncbi:MAG: hypothetical protein ACUVQI_02795 [Thermochromatium sp.]